MELGNMMFGNSRGEAEIPREDAWAEPLFDLFRACGVDEYRAYPGYENDTFVVRGYDWDAECSCGFDRRAEEWDAAHPHAADCYDIVRRKLMADYDASSGYRKAHDAAFGGDARGLLDGFDEHTEHPELGVTVSVFTPRTDRAMDAWRVAHDAREKYEKRLLRKLCVERGLPYPDGCMVHCTCYREKAADIWFAANGHNSDCRLIQPNFLFKPTGFRANWYKYPLRDSYMTPPVSISEWLAMLEACKHSLVAVAQNAVPPPHQ